MKKGDYINVQGPMVWDLHLSGKNELLLFALIHGYSKDGKSTCRVSLKYMSEWLCTSKSAVVRTLNDLEEAGYINRLEYYEGKVKCVQYTTNYEDLLARAEKGEYISLESAKAARKASKSEGGLKMRPVAEGPLVEGSQNETGLKMITKGSQNETGGGLKMRPNNNNIINYNNSFYCADSTSAQEEQEEKDDLYRIFFFRNAADPAVEVERFVAYNESLSWTNAQGRRYETREQRQALARFWTIQSEGQWARPDYLNAVRAICDAATRDRIDGADSLINHRVKLVWDGAHSCWSWQITADARRWVEAHSDIVKVALEEMVKGCSVKFKMVQ